VVDVRIAAALIVALLAGCGTARHAQPAQSSDGKAVLRDASDGHLDRDWSCGSLRAAVKRLPEGLTISLVAAAAGHACDQALAQLRDRDSKAHVASLLGQPDRAPRCWLYRWPPTTSSAIDGARICFSHNRVSLIQTAVHG
jgi:uncharacterized protein YceK